MRRNGDIYEYIAVYIDDIAIAAKKPQSIIDSLLKDYKFKLKGIGPTTFHLGCDFGCDPDGTMWFGPRKYAQRMLKTYKMLFETEPKKATSPLEKNDHPELDD